ncbi:hypothetical protein [Shewanella sp. NIFS-20-20]|uniref:hypothetical protein n=1 Tax=Shewanella sp. NIFS-20-20 TaxID=2853806 RepID=UPI001C48774A|nr:hypothetical protein [Shewanella sp. NIFS-20-20]MBV7317625.1 hypothetical protein [Shewanella sp. NIFS-20-20]
MLYKNEFGSDFDLGFNLNDYSYLNDKSWHNDASPSFYFNVGSQYYVLWVDYSEPSKREDSNSRYLIQEAINEGSENDPEVYSSDGGVIFESEKTRELNQFLKALFTHSGK